MRWSTLRQPTAVVPIAMSLAALALIFWHIAVAGVARQADEGAEAHLWQLLMAGQIPIIATASSTGGAFRTRGTACRRDRSRCPGLPP